MEVVLLANLRTIRNNQGLTRSQLAVKAHVGERTIARAETGKPVRRLTIAKICTALGVTIDQVDELNILE